jgi:hypothetical protein
VKYVIEIEVSEDWDDLALGIIEAQAELLMHALEEENVFANVTVPEVAPA